MGTLSIINAGVFDGVSDGLADGPVHVADGRIVSVGGPPQSAGKVIDARGGMWSPDSQRTIVQDGRVIADSRAPC